MSDPQLFDFSGLAEHLEQERQEADRAAADYASSSTPDRWLLDHLVRAGHLTESGLSRRARLRTCGKSFKRGRWKSRCHDLVLGGLDDDRCALEVHVDPTPLSPLGEALALVEGRRTLELCKLGGGWVLERRTDLRITAHPAGSVFRGDVVRQHRCGTGRLPAPLVSPSAFPEVAPPAAADSAPPF